MRSGRDREAEEAGERRLGRAAAVEPCGGPRVSPCRPKKSPGATGAEGGPRPNLPLQARPAPHPTSPSAPDPAVTPLERLAELMDGKMSGRAEAVRDRAGGEAGELGRGGGEDAERVAGGGVDGREAAEAGV